MVDMTAASERAEASRNSDFCRRSIAARCQKEHLVLESVRAERPTVTEDHRPTRAPARVQAQISRDGACKHAEVAGAFAQRCLERVKMPVMACEAL